MSVVELGQAAVELAGALETAVVGVTACQNRPCPFLAGLSMGGGVYGGGGEEVHNRGDRRRDWNIGWGWGCMYKGSGRILLRCTRIGLAGML